MYFSRQHTRTHTVSIEVFHLIFHVGVFALDGRRTHTYATTVTYGREIDILFGSHTYTQA